MSNKKKRSRVMSLCEGIGMENRKTEEKKMEPTRKEFIQAILNIDVNEKNVAVVARFRNVLKKIKESTTLSQEDKIRCFTMIKGQLIEHLKNFKLSGKVLENFAGFIGTDDFEKAYDSMVSAFGGSINVIRFIEVMDLCDQIEKEKKKIQYSCDKELD